MANRPALSFASRDWILLTRVENMTGDPVFDNSLDTAFRVSLEQSMYANVFSASRVAAALKRMGKAGLEAVDVPVGREICQRESIRGLVSPTISQVGRSTPSRHGSLTPPPAIPCAPTRRADSKDHVLGRSPTSRPVCDVIWESRSSRFSEPACRSRRRQPDRWTP